MAISYGKWGGELELAVWSGDFGLNVTKELQGVSVTSPLSLLPTILPSCTPQGYNAIYFQLCIEVVEEEEWGKRELFVRIRLRNTHVSISIQFQKLNLTLPNEENASQGTAMWLSKKTFEVIQAWHTTGINLHFVIWTPLLMIKPMSEHERSACLCSMWELIG